MSIHKKVWWLWMLAALFLTGFVVVLTLGLVGMLSSSSSNCSYEPPQLLEFPILETNQVSKFSAWGTRNWGPMGYHQGTDIQVTANSTVVSPVTGTVGLVEYIPYSQNPQHVMYAVRVDMGDWRVGLVFEPDFDSTIPENHQSQIDNILVKVGDHLTVGQTVGTLLFSPNKPVLHLYLHHALEGDESINEGHPKPTECPYRYSTVAAQEVYHTIATASGTDPCCYGCTTP